MNILITIAAAAASLSTTTNATDTVMSVNNAAKVTVTESTAGVTVTIDGTDDNPEYQATFTREYSSESTVKSTQQTTRSISYAGGTGSHHWDAIVGGWGVGFAGTAGGAMPMSMGKSFEFQWLYVLGARYTMPHGSINFGIGMNWRNYKISTSDIRFIQSAGGGVGQAPYPDGTIARGSQLKIASLTLPVIWNHWLPVSLFGYKIQMSGGVILNWNHHASVMAKWLDAKGNETEESCKSVGQRKFSVDLTGTLRLCSWAGIYFKYSPMKLLDSRSPGFHPFSTGIELLY
ncbi:MAG: hypothetical protein K2L49_09365 [Muribaculaceae bacterium]|nr:hypothetical protein [Muribaculaceae bacterium]